MLAEIIHGTDAAIDGPEPAADRPRTMPDQRQGGGASFGVARNQRRYFGSRPIR
jgi:hypothetical protein